MKHEINLPKTAADYIQEARETAIFNEASSPAEIIGRLEKAAGKKLKPGLTTLNGIDVNLIDTEDGDTDIMIEIGPHNDLGKLKAWLKSKGFKIRKEDEDTVGIS